MVSIISPVYNCAPYIRECIDSLRSQTYQDFEVLLVDDHGQDDAMQIARGYVEGDPRFRFLQTSVNSGPGMARNVGIEAAQGEYVAFIDSDDVWLPTFLECLLAAASGGKDLAYCQLQYRGGTKDGRVHRNPVVPAGEFCPQAKAHFLKHFVTFSVCFLFRRQFLMDHGLRFPSQRNSEDTNFLTRCLLLAQSIACADQPLYIYCVREDSLTTGKNRRRYKERLDAMNLLMREFKAMKCDARYASLQLQQYDGAMRLIWLKKGLAQCILELIKNLK